LLPSLDFGGLPPFFAHLESVALSYFEARALPPLRPMLARYSRIILSVPLFINLAAKIYLTAKFVKLKIRTGVVMGGTSQEFDRQLLTRKLFKPAREMQMESLASDSAARSAKLAGSVLTRIVDGQLVVLRKWLETVDRICREVWQTQGETITPEFVREILVPEASMVIAARAGVSQSGVSNIAARTHEDPHGALRWLAMEVNRLKGEVANRYEIEAREIEYRIARTTPEEERKSKQGSELGGTKPARRPRVRIPPPIEPVNTSWGGGLRHTGEAEHRAKPEELTERADKSVLPPGLCGVGDPVDGNPFPRENPRHAHWQQATLKAEEELCLLNVQFMKNSITRERFAEWVQRGGPFSAERELAAWTLNFVAAKFDIWAKRACHVVWDEYDLKVFDKWLFDYAESWLRAKRDDAILPELRARLIERMEYWKAASRGTLSELRRVDAENSDKTATRTKAKPIGRPRKDAERELIRKLKAEGNSWKEIAAKANAQTGQNKTAEAYRSLLKSWSEVGKNEQK